MNANLISKLALDPSLDDLPELALCDDDVLDAMQHIPGYLDITIEDFRQVYHLAHSRALHRLFDGITATRLMRTGIPYLDSQTTLDKAAKIIADSGFKSLPVVDADHIVVGMLTETDFLKLFKTDRFMRFLLNMLDESFEFSHRCHETHVDQAMTKPAVTVRAGAQFMDIMKAFRSHGGRSMPVVHDDGRLLGLLLRKDFYLACPLSELL